MRLLNFLAQAFIAAFGITQPTAEKQRLVSLILGGFLLGIAALVLVIGVFFYFQLHGGR